MIVVKKHMHRGFVIRRQVRVTKPGMRAYGNPWEFKYSSALYDHEGARATVSEAKAAINVYLASVGVTA